MVARPCYIIVAVDSAYRGSIVTIESVFGSEPHKPVAILEDHFYLTLRQTFFTRNMRKVIVERLSVCSLYPRQEEYQQKNAKNVFFHKPA